MAIRLQFKVESMRRLILASSHRQEGVLRGCEQGQVFWGSFSHSGPMHRFLGGGRRVGAERMAKRLW